MSTERNIAMLPVGEIIEKFPFAADFFHSNGIDSFNAAHTIGEIVERIELSFFEDKALSRELLIRDFEVYITALLPYSQMKYPRIESLSILPGHDKSGVAESFTLNLKPGEVYCIVGPTGSGKSRLLADIECLAQGDTPTGRFVSINGKEPTPQMRFAPDHKLIAQLTQNMNFVMDISVLDFIQMHAESRMVTDVDGVVSAVIDCANDLAGEMFSAQTPLTQLSGGQSRALMIADTALISRSPIVLIDEIENAGVDRRRSLDLLVKKDKIVLLSTHDPILALLGDVRIVIKNGGIAKVFSVSDEERAQVAMLTDVDAAMNDIRNMIRRGEEIRFNVEEFLRSRRNDHE